jgi:hypothetical protein
MTVTFEELELLEFSSSEEVIEFFHEVFGSIEEVESFLEIEFAYVDGTYANDYYTENSPVKNLTALELVEWSSQAVDLSIYRQRYEAEETNLPKTYPAKLYYASVGCDTGFFKFFYKWIN